MERNARKGSAKRHQNKFFPVDEDLLFEKSLPKSCFCRAAILIYLKCMLSLVFFLSFASSNVCNAPQRRRKAENAFDS